MLFKKLSLLLMLMFVYVNINASCVYLEDHSSCDFITSQGLNEFNLDVSNLGNYDELSVALITPSNEIVELERLSNQQTVFYQSKVLPIQGVYQLRVNAILEDGISSVENSYSLLYTDSTPMPPVIEEVTQLSSPQDTIRIEGFINNYLDNDEVLVFNNGVLVSTQLLIGESFDITIPLNDQNKIELLVNRPSLNSQSPKTRFMFYKDVDEIVFDRLATITSVDFLDEEAIILDSNSNKITTQSPFYFVSGQAQDGDIVYIQGVPTPVINGEFNTFLFLNEGVDEICIYGNNSNCIDFETIYSYKNELYNLEYSITDSSISFDNENFNKLSELSLNKNPVTLSANINVNTYSINRNFHVVDIKYPGIYEKKYLITDTIEPTIEIISSDNLYPFSEFVISFSDDISVDLDSLQINVGGQILNYADSVSKNTIGKISYATFLAPQVTRSGVEIVASIQDTSGNLVTDRKTVNLNGNIGNHITINVLGTTNLYGNRLIFSNFQTSTQLEIYSSNTEGINEPIALDITSIDSKYISSYSISDENVIQLNLDLTYLQAFSELEIPVLIYDQATDTFEENPFNFQLQRLDTQINSDEQIQIIDSRIDEKLVIVKLLNPIIDYSTLSVNSNTNSYYQIGDYLFISFNDVSLGTSKTLSYSDLGGNYYSFPIFQEDSFSGSLSLADEIGYQSIFTTSSYPIQFDMFVSSRYDDSKVMLKPRQNQFFNPSFIEGTSIQSLSLFVPNEKRTLQTNILRNSQFNFQDYPSIFIEDNNIFYRGLLRSTTEISSVVQGRVTGNEEVVFARANQEDCDLTNRFFICYVDTNNYENIINMTFINDVGEVIHNGTINITNPNRTEPSELSLDLLKNQNVFLSSEGFTFSSGEITFNFTPNVAGTHSLFVNGQLIDTFEILDINQIDLVLEQQDYENDNENGAFLDVKVQDQSLIDSNTITLRFIRFLDAIVNIIVS